MTTEERVWVAGGFLLVTMSVVYTRTPAMQESEVVGRTLLVRITYIALRISYRKRKSCVYCLYVIRNTKYAIRLSYHFFLRRTQPSPAAAPAPITTIAAGPVSPAGP